MVLPPPPPPSFFAFPLPPPFPLPPSTQNPNPASIQPPPATDLPSAISLLTDLSNLADSTLRSLSSLLPSSSSSSFSSSQCPFDRRHRMPPSSLFSHSLRCPSAPGGPIPDPSSLLDPLRYPSSVQSRPSPQQPSLSFHRPLPTDDLCFSLEAELGDLGSNFFYKDCPGVVTTPEPDASARTFSLPGFLSVECANFIIDRDDGQQSKILGTGILPSESWALKLELEAWNDFPVSYSYTFLRVASAVHLVGNCSLKSWVVYSSPHFGIIIDSAMSEHICLLLKLCLMAIGREARSLMELHLSKDGILDPRSISFDCPRLIGSLNWLASQLSVLYGEVNAKFLSIAMLKEALLKMGLLLVVGIEENKFEEGCEAKGASDNNRFEPNKSEENMEFSSSSDDHSRQEILVSQVAAAVAALHERSWLEERIKAMRYAQPIPKPQLLLEYTFASARAREERKKRPNYKPLLEHDGLLWHRAQNQGSGKVKTKEELLAEERDYKRRRMSYRGKKVKRNSLQVLRDIIEEHMEEIKQAGGAGCNVRVGTDTTLNNLQNDADHLNSKSSDIYLSDTRGKSPAYNELPHRDFSSGDRSNISHHLLNKFENTRDEHYWHADESNRGRSERQKNYRSRGPSSDGTYSLSKGIVHSRGQSDVEGSKYERLGYDYSKSKDDTSRSTLISRYSRKEDNYKANYSKNREKSYESYRSESVTQERFEERYDPTSSYEEKLYYPGNDEKEYNKKRRYDHSSRRHNKDHI